MRQRAHRNLAAAVATAATQLGMHADLERFIPELYAKPPAEPAAAEVGQAAEQDDQRIDRALHRAAVDRVRVSTDRPFGDDLARYLRQRERRS